MTDVTHLKTVLQQQAWISRIGYLETDPELGRILKHAFSGVSRATDPNVGA